MKLGVAIVVGTILGGCAASQLSKEDAQVRDQYVLDEQVCIARVKVHELTKAEGYDCICLVKAKAGRPCPVPTKDGGS
jgi:hypothetical protein